MEMRHKNSGQGTFPPTIYRPHFIGDSSIKITSGETIEFWANNEQLAVVAQIDSKEGLRIWAGMCHTAGIQPSTKAEFELVRECLDCLRLFKNSHDASWGSRYEYETDKAMYQYFNSNGRGGPGAWSVHIKALESSIDLTEVNCMGYYDNCDWDKLQQMIEFCKTEIMKVHQKREVTEKGIATLFAGRG